METHVLDYTKTWVGAKEYYDLYESVASCSCGQSWTIADYQDAKRRFAEHRLDVICEKLNLKFSERD